MFKHFTLFICSVGFCVTEKSVFFFFYLELTVVDLGFWVFLGIDLGLGFTVLAVLFCCCCFKQ